jgi:hypothetical protein
VRWLVLFGGIGVWLVHLTGAAALAPLACDDRWALWGIHGLTALTAVIVMGQLVLSYRMRLAGDQNMQFLSDVGVIVNVTNLLLILFEGSYVLFVRACG